MSTTKQQRIATGMMWAARVIGCGAVVFLLGVLFLSLMWRALWASDILFLVYLGIALAGCIVSSRRLWLAGTILVLVSFAFGSALGLSSPWGIAVLVAWSPEFGLPFFFSGVLFLLSWWLSRKTSSSASTLKL